MIALLAVLAELCGPVPAADAPDPAEAAAYVAVADDALAAGDTRVAATAYRKALAAEPTNPRARAQLAALCAADTAPAAPDDAAELLEGIAHYKRGELAAGTQVFAPIAARGGAAAAGAHFFLALIALRDHDRDRVLRELALAASDPDYRALSASTRRLAVRDGRVRVLAAVEPELDTNALLLPDTPPAGATGHPVTDEDLALLARLDLRIAPALAIGNALRYRRQRTLHALDLLSNTTDATLALAAGGHHLVATAGLDLDALAGTRYLRAEHGTLGDRVELASVTLGALYRVRRRDFLQPAQRTFDGWIHGGELVVGLRLAADLEVDLAAVGTRELTADPTFANAAAGGRLAARYRPTAAARLALTLEAARAWYDVAQPDGVVRRDVHGEVGLDAEFDLADRVIALAGADLTLNDSTVEDFRYHKLIVRLGLAISFGVL